MKNFRENARPTYHKELTVYLERGIDYTEADLVDVGFGSRALNPAKILEIKRAIGYTETIHIGYENPNPLDIAQPKNSIFAIFSKQVILEEELENAKKSNEDVWLGITRDNDGLWHVDAHGSGDDLVRACKVLTVSVLNNCRKSDCSLLDTVGAYCLGLLSEYQNIAKMSCNKDSCSIDPVVAKAMEEASRHGQNTL